MDLLILGGTAFLGPEIVDAATRRGWKLTLFNRGKTRAELFPDLEKIRGDRDPSKGEGLKELEAAIAKGRRWDGVIDTFICDGLGHKPGKVCTHDLDNIALSLKPLGSLGGPMVRKPTPSQADREQLGKIDADLVKAKKELQTVSAQKPYATAYAVAEGKAGNARIQLRVGGVVNRPQDIFVR
jgi:hypothetical protein